MPGEGMMELSDRGADAHAILAMADHDIPGFIDQQIKQKTLSSTMQSLNAEVLSDQDEARRMARQALRKLGFI